MLVFREEEMEDFPPGYRFYPTEEELVSFYLHHKVDGTRHTLISIINRIIPVLDIYDFNPWDLPQFSGESSHGDPEQWFFFVPRQEVEARGGRPKRLTDTGYWKATGSPGVVYSSTNRTIGVKRTMVFYNGRAPKGTKTQWKMNEYKVMEASDQSYSSSSLSYPRIREEFSLCRVYKKSKCLRAFDRRPVGAEMETVRAANQNRHSEEGEGNPPLMTLESFMASSVDGAGETKGDCNNNEGGLDWEMLAEIMLK